MTTIQDLINDINTKLVASGADLIDDADIRSAFNKVVDLLGQAQTADIIPDWTAGLTFQTDGSDAGRYCAHPDANGKSRIWKTKVDDNTGNEPPTDPGLTSDANWEEKSPSVSLGDIELKPGIYGSGLVIGFWNHSIEGPNLYLLTEPTRPFESVNIEAEITTGQWKKLGGIGTKELDTSGAVITLDMDKQQERIFTSSDVIDGVRTWAFANAENARTVRSFTFELDGVHVQTLPASVKMADLRWNSGAKTWTPDSAGQYEAIMNYDTKNATWRVRIFGPDE